MADEGKGGPLWLQHQSDEIVAVLSGLRDGDLEPLARFMKSGGLPESPPDAVALPRLLVNELVGMIEGAPHHHFHLYVKGRKPNEQGWTRGLELRERNFRIGYFVEEQKRERGRGSYESVLQDAEIRFSEPRGTIKRAHGAVKKWIEGAEKTRAEWREAFPNDPAELPDPFEILKRAYSRE